MRRTPEIRGVRKQLVMHGFRAEGRILALFECVRDL